jgi:hypothetical protein
MFTLEGYSCISSTVLEKVLWGLLALSVVLAALKGVRFFPNEYRRLRATKSSQRARLFNSFMYFHLLCVHIPLLLSLCASRAILELNIGVDVIPTVLIVIVICEIPLLLNLKVRISLPSIGTLYAVDFSLLTLCYIAALSALLLLSFRCAVQYTLTTHPSPFSSLHLDPIH